MSLICLRGILNLSRRSFSLWVFWFTLFCFWIFEKNEMHYNRLLSNACTLMPTVFRWHGKMESTFHFHFSFSRDIEKQIWILLSVFRFRLTLKNRFELRISFFVFASLWKTDKNFVSRFRITLKNGFEFRFCMACYWKTDLNFVCRFCMTWKTDLCTSPVIWGPRTHPRGWPGHSLFMQVNFPLPGAKVRGELPPPPPWQTRYSLF